MTYLRVVLGDDAMRLNHFAQVGTALLVGILAGCGGGSSVTTPPQKGPQRFAYVANLVGGLYVYSVDDASGELTLVVGSPFGQGSSFGIAVDPSLKFLYTADCFSQEVTAFSLDSTSGTVAPPQGTSLTPGICPLALAVHPSGKFLFVLSGGFFLGGQPENPITLSSLTIDPVTGTLADISGGSTTVGTGNFTGEIVADVSGKFVYWTDPLGYINSAGVDTTTGILTPAGAFATGSGPYGLAVYPSGGLLFVANQITDDVSTMAIDASGTLTEIARTAVGHAPRNVAIDSKGRFLFVTNNGSDDVSAFSIDARGKLTPVSGSPFPSGKGPNYLAIDPNGKFVLVTNETSGDISVCSIDPSTGALKSVSGSPFFQGNQPQGITLVAR
jgi:6-phosphogluconolactonase